jgi:hypothetical protein
MELIFVVEGQIIDPLVTKLAVMSKLTALSGLNIQRNFTAQ